MSQREADDGANRTNLEECEVCSRMISRQNIYRHLRNIHKYSDEDIERVKRALKMGSSAKEVVTCPICDKKFLDQEGLAGHCLMNHSEDGANGDEQDYTVHSFTFGSEETFETWLKEKCEETVTTFYKRDSKKNLYYLRCHRAGKFVSKGDQRVTSSIKDVTHCSCYLNVSVNDDGSVHVKGCLGHVGHKVEPALLRITEEQKEFIKSLLEEHSLDYVIRRLRKDFSAQNSRLHFITKMDLWNIIQKNGMRPGFRDGNDMRSLQIREQEHNPDDGILLLEMAEDPSGKGFALVIITPIQVEWLQKYSSRGISVDDTHGATRYNLKLATVVVADEKDRGLPAAFLLSGTMTAADVVKLFSKIKEVFPGFDPKQVVTDEAPCFYNGFRTVFPNTRAKLHYCRWHVSQTWERKLKEMVEPHVRHKVKSELKQLLLIGQLDQFQVKFAEILALLDVEGQRRMAQYLRTNYLGRTTSWASFAVQGAVMETTMLSERWHLRLKNEVLQRNANSRVDCLVELLIRAVEDLAQSNEINDRRRLARASYRIRQTTSNHRLATSYMAENPQVVERIDEKKWEIACRRREEKFIVTIERECSCSTESSSNVHCPLCQVCPYSWACTCLDGRAGICCVHIHAVAITEAGVISESRARGDSPTQITTGHEPQTLAPAQLRLESRKSLRSKIEMTFTVTSANVNKLVNEDSSEAEQKLKEIYDLIDRSSKIKVSEPSTSQDIAPRPEMSRPGNKPQQTKADLYTRAAHRRKQNKRKGKVATDVGSAPVAPGAAQQLERAALSGSDA